MDTAATIAAWVGCIGFLMTLTWDVAIAACRWAMKEREKEQGGDK